MVENDLMNAEGTTLSASADGGPALAPPSGNPVVPVEPSVSLGQSHDHGGAANERLVRPIAFRRSIPYLSIRAGLLDGRRIEAANERRDIRYGGGESWLWHRLDDSVELLLSPETALTMRFLKDTDGIPTPHGRYLPHVPAAAPPEGSKAAADESSRLLAALAIPRYGNWYPLSGHYDPTLKSVVMTAGRYDRAGRPLTLATEHFDADAFADHLAGLPDLGDRPVLLVMGGVDVKFATAVARRSGHDLFITVDDIRQDDDLHAVGGQWLYIPASGGDPIAYGADLYEAMSAHLGSGMSLTRAEGMRYPDPPVIWTNAPSTSETSTDATHTASSSG